MPSKSRGGARSCITVAPMPQGRIFSARWQGRVGVKVDPGCGIYSLRLMLSGNYRYEDGRGVFCSNPDLLIPPDQLFGGSFQDISLLFLDVSREAVERALGAPAPDGLGLRALPAARGASLRDLAFAAMREAEQLPERLRTKFLRNFGNMMACAIASLLREIRPEYFRRDPMIGRRKIADLQEWAGLDYDEPLTVGDLASHCGLGLRALEKNFLRHFDTTPTLYLRELRLGKVRKMLQDGAARTSVTEAAITAGFAHLGRFSALYRQRFGELPSETLARTQGAGHRQ